MTDKVQPALTPELWGKAKVWVPEGGADPGGRLRHALGALCLYGQPYGFTHEDVGILSKILKDATDEGLVRVDSLFRAASILDRISALLPPEPTL